MTDDYWERLREIWRQERLREDEMLAFYDQCKEPITRKALAEKFDLKATRVCLLVRRHVEYQERERLAVERVHMEAELEGLKGGAAFTRLAEGLWMTLGWLAQELEERSHAARDPR
jgi:uncharacterized protein (UPF0335 family)